MLPRMAGTEKREQALYWPESMLQEIQQHAYRTDRSLSYIAQLAWKTAGAAIRGSDYDRVKALVGSYEGSDKRKQSLFFPVDMLAEMESESVRLDSSISLVAQAAFVLAKSTIEGLPDNTDASAG